MWRMDGGNADYIQIGLRTKICELIKFGGEEKLVKTSKTENQRNFALIPVVHLLVSLGHFCQNSKLCLGEERFTFVRRLHLRRIYGRLLIKL